MTGSPDRGARRHGIAGAVAAQVLRTASVVLIAACGCAPVLAQTPGSAETAESRRADWEVSGAVRLPPEAIALGALIVGVKWTESEARTAFATQRLWPENAAAVANGGFRLRLRDHSPVTLVVARLYAPDAEGSRGGRGSYACHLSEQVVVPPTSGAHTSIDFDLRSRIWVSTLRFVDAAGLPIAGVDCAETGLDTSEASAFQRPFGWRGRSGANGEVLVLRTQKETLVHALREGYLLTSTRCRAGDGVIVVTMPAGAFLSVQLSADVAIPASVPLVVGKYSVNPFSG